jgi:hypothetical protein
VVDLSPRAGHAERVAASSAAPDGDEQASVHRTDHPAVPTVRAAFVRADWKTIRRVDGSSIDSRLAAQAPAVRFEPP